MRRLALLALLGALSACAAAPQGPLPIQRLQAELMHTQWDFHVPAASPARAEALVARAVELVEALDAKLAMWKPGSELAQLNATAGSGRSVTVSADLRSCLDEAQRAFAASGGALDVSVGPLTQAWWQARQEQRLLRPAELRALKARMGFAELRYDRERGAVTLPRPGMQLDLGALAKGRAQDQVAAYLESQGVHAFLLNAGGQVYARGRKPDGRPWSVGIEHPRDPQKVIAVLELEDACVSTSGDNQQFSVIQGRRVHHILDPRSGLSVKGMASATAVLRFKAGDAHAALRSDAASTAAFVLGAEAGLAYLTAQGFEGILVAEESRGLRALKSPGLQAVPVILKEP